MKDEERDILGAALLSPELTQQIKLNADQFASPQAGAIWQAIGVLRGAGRQPDPILIVDEAARYGVRVEHQSVVELIGCGLAVNADVYADKIRDSAERRRVSELLARAQLKLNAGDATEAVIGEVAAGLDAESPMEFEVSRAETLDEFLNKELPPLQWVIPGLLTKGDRLVLTGVEGGGKSLALRQIGICAAAGRHPFTLDAMEPCRVLYVDCENPEMIMQKTMRRIAAPLQAQGAGFGDRMWVKRFPQGIDLSKANDRLLLHTMCRTFQPDVLIVGPAYKMCQSTGIMKDEDIARVVTMTLDGLREEFGCCVILEHHSPHRESGAGSREVRPIGSSLWLRWPEFGYGLRPSQDADPDVRKVDFVPWRGARDQRDWPRQLVQGTTVPWVAATTPGY